MKKPAMAAGRKRTMQTRNGKRPPTLHRFLVAALIILGAAILISPLLRTEPLSWTWR